VTATTFYNQAYFLSYAPVSGETVSIRDAPRHPNSRTRNVTLQCQLPEGLGTVVIQGAIHVPKLATNLISLGDLQKEGAKLEAAETD
jgi:hypothetical protein